ncbi:TetR/AcrR family transcriptional regulator [Streptomyces sp. S1D4-11]
MTTKSQRRLYAEGVARRAEILQVALSAYQSSGRQGPTLKSIAQAAGLTEAGVLHYFDSKDALLAAIIEERDHLYAETYDVTTLDGVWAVLAHTVRTPWPGQALRRHERRGGRPPGTPPTRSCCGGRRRSTGWRGRCWGCVTPRRPSRLDRRH